MPEENPLNALYLLFGLGMFVAVLQIFTALNQLNSEHILPERVEPLGKSFQNGAIIFMVCAVGMVLLILFNIF